MSTEAYAARGAWTTMPDRRPGKDSSKMQREGEVVELLQQLIRNECVNDDRVESGQEMRRRDVLETYLEGPGSTSQTYEPAPGRRSLVARDRG